MTTSQGEELLRNGDFSEGTPGRPTSLTGVRVAGDSAAPWWTVWNNTEATTTTELVLNENSAAPGLPDHIQMIQVTAAPRNGIVQKLPQPVPGPAVFEVMVFVLDNPPNGRAGVGLGLGGEQATTTLTTTHGKWESLQVRSLLPQVQEVTIYSTENTSFYVGDASLTNDGDEGNN